MQPFGWMVPRSQYDGPPTWFVHCGLVFQPLTLDYLRTWNRWWDKAPPELLFYYYCSQRTAEQQEVVLLTQILADEATVGYEGLANEAVLSINGRLPRSMEDFVRQVDESQGLLELKTSYRGTVVLDPAVVAEAHPRILERYHIPGDRSPDLDRGSS